jgi:hypothetical protein
MRTRAAVLAETIFVLAVGLTAIGQAPPAPRPSTAAVSGQILDNGAGPPVTDALVTLTGGGLAPRRVVVNPQGRFAFSDLPAGTFYLTATKPGYANGAAGQRTVTGPGRPISLQAAEHRTGLVLPLWRLGSISGTITGDYSERLTGVEVHALRRGIVGGTRHLVDTASSTTDDRGWYHLSGLPVGEYLVLAEPPQNPETPLLLSLLVANPASAADIMAGVTTNTRNSPDVDGRVRTYPLTYYPAALGGPQAMSVTVGPASTRADLDIRMKSVIGARVAGALTSENGPVAGMTVHLVTAETDPGGPEIEAAVAACDKDGHFEFSGVVPGHYAVTSLWTAPPPPPDPAASRAGGPPATPALPEPTLWARQLVTVATANVDNVTAALHPGLTISGQVAFDAATGSPPPNLAGVALRLDPVDPPTVGSGAPALVRGRIAPDGRVTTMGVAPARYLLRATSLPQGWTLVSAVAGGHDLLDEPADLRTSVDDVVLTFSARPLATLNGAVQDAHGDVTSTGAVVVFPADVALRQDTSSIARRIRVVRPSEGGSYFIGGLPPGEYFVAAIDGDPPPDWQEATWLDALSTRATRVRLGIGDAHVLDLQVIRGS